MAQYRGRHRAHHIAGRHARPRHWWLRSIRADPATAGALDDASAKLRKAGAANLNSSVLLLIVFVLITIGLSIGQSQLPSEVQTITVYTAANLALALAISDHIKRNKSS